ncbi:hypothetical protein D3C87_2043530 [compost metagenome]
MVVDRVDAFRHAIDAVAVDGQGLVFPRIEQAQRDVHELFGAGIAPVVPGHGLVAVVAGFGVEHGGHHVPAHAAA